MGESRCCVGAGRAGMASMFMYSSVYFGVLLARREVNGCSTQDGVSFLLFKRSDEFAMNGGDGETMSKRYR